MAAGVGSARQPDKVGMRMLAPTDIGFLVEKIENACTDGRRHGLRLGEPLNRLQFEMAETNLHACGML